jgi:hypothetical protein
MLTKDTIQRRFDELANQAVGSCQLNGAQYVEGRSWGTWSASALNLVQMTFGADSVHYARLKQLIERNGRVHFEQYREALGAFLGAKTDYEKGCYASLDRLVSGEIFGSFVAAAKVALANGQKDVAAVLACAALEDALKKYARTSGFEVEGCDLSGIIGALKSKGLITGAQKGILDAMPKTRNAAMHADWQKITAQEVGGIIGYVEQFLLQNFS